MPRMNKWLADRMQTLFANQFHPVTVSDIQFPAHGLKRVRFSGDLAGAKYQPGAVIEFRVTDEDFRHYTPASFDAEAGVCDVVFYLHGQGVGSQWVEALSCGDSTYLMGPGVKTAYRTSARRHVVFGDETSLGFAAAIADAAAGDDAQVECLLELDPEHRDWPQTLGLPSTVIVKDQLAQTLTARTLDEGDTAFYLTGRAKSIQVFKRALKEQGVNRKSVQTEPFWSEGKRGI